MKKEMNKIRTILLAVCGLAMVHSNANAASTFQIDTLLQVSNERGNGVFTLSNDSNQTVYVKGEVLQVKVIDGEIVKIPLTRENFPIWDLAVNPSKLRLMPGEVRDVAVKYLCQGENCDRSQDRVYQVRFSPVSAEDNSDTTEVKLAFGMAPYYIIPAENQNVEYDWNFDKSTQTVSIENTGNTHVKIEFDNCNEYRSIQQCRAVYHVLAGRYMAIELPEGLRGDNVKVTVANHSQRIEDEFTL